MENVSTTVETPVTFTPEALAALKKINDEENPTRDKVLRVGVKGGGCSGMTYVLELDNQSENDDYFNVDGLGVVLDRRHALYLAGMTIDYQYGLNARGFVFKNPNAKTTCGCGTSFSA